jgi:hypothetical protein
MSTPQEILRRHGIQYVATKKPEYTTTCPRCNDTGYLNVKIDHEGVAWYCHNCKEGGGEKFEKRSSNGNGADTSLGPIKAVFDYVDEDGKGLFQVLRFEPVGKPKQFRQRTGPDQEKWSVKGVRIVPFRLPELMNDLALWSTIFIVEGEKDVNTLRSHGIPATTNPMGAGKWRAEWWHGMARVPEHCIQIFSPAPSSNTPAPQTSHRILKNMNTMLRNACQPVPERSGGRNAPARQS